MIIITSTTCNIIYYNALSSLLPLFSLFLSLFLRNEDYIPSFKIIALSILNRLIFSKVFQWTNNYARWIFYSIRLCPSHRSLNIATPKSISLLMNSQFREFFTPRNFHDQTYPIITFVNVNNILRNSSIRLYILRISRVANF